MLECPPWRCPRAESHATRRAASSVATAAAKPVRRPAPVLAQAGGCPFYTRVVDTGRRRAARPGDPFAALGLPPGPGLTDDDVRAAWRRVAAAAHPDRADGGDPARFAEAAAAYTTLRTAFGRTEALADLAGPRGGRPGQLAGRLRSRRNARRGQAGRAG